MATENYALETAMKLNEIGFAEFTSDLISKTFEAIINANLKQTESFIDLVKEMTKSLSAYINDTKLEISNQEVLDHLGSLPHFVDDQGEPITNQADGAPPDSPVALVPTEKVKASALNALNKTFTNGQLASTILQAAGNPAVTNLLKDGLGLVKGLLPAVGGTFTQEQFNKLFPAGNNHSDYYDPVEFKSLLIPASGTPPASAFIEATKTAELTAASMAKLYDSVAEVIAGDKYALLQEMVKLGVLRLVVTEGVIRTSLTFSSWERSSSSSSSYEKHAEHVQDKYKQKQAPSHGILKLIRNRPLEKTKRRERDVHVQTTSEQGASSQGTTISIFGGVEIRFKTDYLPVAQA